MKTPTPVEWLALPASVKIFVSCLEIQRWQYAWYSFAVIVIEGGGDGVVVLDGWGRENFSRKIRKRS